MHEPAIRIFGARQNNLKNLDIDIPLNRMTVISGVSGSGKSSLAFDTLYAEGQRRYVETFSPYSRQFMDRMDRPRVDRIEGIPAAIAIDRKNPVRTSRSTVGTMTEITDYVKLLFARLGQMHCRNCGCPVRADTPDHVWQWLQQVPSGAEVIISFPQPLASHTTTELKAELNRQGFDRLVVLGRVEDLGAWQPQDTDPTVNVLADRFRMRHRDRKRILDSIELAMRFGAGRIHVWLPPQPAVAFSRELACAHCDIAYPQPTANLFSFNSPMGACDTCRGFGRTIDIDLDLIIPDRSLSLSQGAIKPWHNTQGHRTEFEDLKLFCRSQGIPLETPFEKLSAEHQRAIIEGSAEFYGIRGFFNWLETKTYKMPVRVFLSRYRSYDICRECRGTRFKPDTLLYRLGNMNIAQIYARNVWQALDFFRELDLPTSDGASRLIRSEVQQRLEFMRDVGLGYLTLDRQSRTLSGGEVQRVSLAAALGSSLVNTLYVLDEPSIGLHPRDSQRLIRILKHLRDLHNTVVVVEHDPEIIRSGDFLLDLGPRAGEHGGKVMYFGPTAAVDGSLTGQYLRGQRTIPLPTRRRKPQKGAWLSVHGARAHNLKNISARLPLGLFICLTGVSGSGKSTLAELLFRGLKAAKGDPHGRPGAHRSLAGTEMIDDVVLVDQGAIGRTPRANPLTYMGAMDPIRRLLADTPRARALKLPPGHFSFNVAGGRCETCRGEGFQRVEMQFLSDVYVTCPDCGGRRFTHRILDVRHRGHNIDDLLNLTVDAGMQFFQNHPKITNSLEPLVEVGLGYLRLGQPLNTLSGGEAQRLKLARHLNTRGRRNCLFIFDEPTTGLHLEDIAKLLHALERLITQGHTVLVIEHNMDVVKTADWIIDLGPEGGEAGGEIVATGAPEKIARQSGSHTGQFLQPHLLACKDTWQPAAPTVSRVAEPAPVEGPGTIQIRGAREHNLKNVAVSIPRNRLVVLTGVSGSGKSTLAFDILFAEGQRRYLESLTPYVRQYLQIQERPEVDLVSGLAPTVAIQQRISHVSRRSTVATLTEIYHFLRLLFSKLGAAHCPDCGRRLTVRSRGSITAEIERRFGRGPAEILAPKISGRKGYHKQILAQALKRGFTRARIDGAMVTLIDDMALSRYHTHDIDIVVGSLPAPDSAEMISRALDEGDGSLAVVSARKGEEMYSLRGLCPACGTGVARPDPRLFSFNSPRGACGHCEGLGQIEDGPQNADPDAGPRFGVCPHCMGSRLSAEALAVKIDGRSIWDIVRQPAGQATDILATLSIDRHHTAIAEPILAEIQTRLGLMKQLGLGYLALGRSGDTLSGGEAQRLRLAAQLGSNLTGVCYILDEPTIGLHPRDTAVLIAALKILRDRGNTIVVVEHDEATIRQADHVIDLGPGAGQDGGQVVASGELGDLKQSNDSITAAYLWGVPQRLASRGRPYHDFPAVTVHGACENNLRDIQAQFPLGCLIAVSGVSGSGKSTLLKTTLYQGLRNRLRQQQQPAGCCREISGWDRIQRVLEVDHSPIGRTPRSVPASYVGLWTQIRQLFAATPGARTRGYAAGRFSFNTPGGRCEACKGQGRPKVAMSFLPDVYVQCEVCGGRRYNPETLEVYYGGQTIADILALTFERAAELFAAVPKIRAPLQMVCDVGLGYLQLGQPSPTLSGGEAQRIKLARQLARPANGHTFYILDEPTTGLHLADVQRLVAVLQQLVDQGNTVALIEHNPDLIRACDYVIDLGPEGGAGGGRVVAAGSPAELLSHAQESYTARYLE